MTAFHGHSVERYWGELRFTLAQRLALPLALFVNSRTAIHRRRNIKQRTRAEKVILVV
tara:strand:- start:26316 stop:26489 length:174 start_codon:yes stop_codon:yes gene_type:complete